MRYKILDLVNGEYINYKNGSSTNSIFFESQEQVDLYLTNYIQVIDVLYNTGEKEKMNVLGKYFTYLPIREHYEVIEVE